MMQHQDHPAGVQIISPREINILPACSSRCSFAEGIAHIRSGGKSCLALDSSRPFVALDKSFVNILDSNPTVRVISHQPERAFAHEAGIYVPETNEVWFTSNLIRDGKSIHVDISKINMTTFVVDTVSVNDISLGNGGCLYGCRLLFCDQGTMDQPSQLVLVDPMAPSTCSQPILNNYHGRPFNSLNDVITLRHPHDSTKLLIFFTDPTYGFEQGFRPQPQLPSHVYCFDPDIGDIRAVADGFCHPNGICFDPSGSVCYITDTGHIHGTGLIDPAKTSTIYAYDVVWRGCDKDAIPQLHNRRLFAFADSGVPDGIKCDLQGNVYSGCGDGLHIWNSAGRLIGKILFEFAEGGIKGGCANFCFTPGGRIVCFAEDRIYLVEGLLSVD